MKTRTKDILEDMKGAESLAKMLGSTALLKQLRGWQNALLELEEQASGNPQKDIYVPVLQRDTGNPMRNGGSIVMETMTINAGLCEITERAKSLSTTYGTVYVCRLVPVCEISPEDEAKYHV